MKIKFILTFLFFAFFGLSHLFAQGTLDKKASFDIEPGSTIRTKDYYLNVLSHANMESYRLRDKAVTVFFKDGTRCILLSAKTLSARGENINIDDYREDFPEGYIMPVFNINSDGHLLAEYKKKLK